MFKVVHKERYDFQRNCAKFYENLDQEAQIDQSEQFQLFALDSLLQVSNSIVAHSQSKNTLFSYLYSLDQHQSDSGLLFVRQFLCDNVREYDVHELRLILRLLMKVCPTDDVVQLFFCYLMATPRFLQPLKLDFVPNVNFYQFQAPKRKAQNLEAIFAEKCKDIVPYQTSLRWLMQSGTAVQDLAFLLRCESLGVAAISYVLHDILRGDCIQLLSPFSDDAIETFAMYSAAQRRVLAICLLYGASRGGQASESDFQLLGQLAADSHVSQVVYVLRVISVIIQRTPRLIAQQTLFSTFVVAARRAGTCEHVPPLLALGCSTLGAAEFLRVPAIARSFLELLQQYGMLNARVVAGLCGASEIKSELAECIRQLHFNDYNSAIECFANFVAHSTASELLSPEVADVFVEFCLQLGKQIAIVYIVYAQKLFNADFAHLLLHTTSTQRDIVRASAQRIYAALSRVQPVLFSEYKANIQQHVGPLQFDEFTAALVFCTNFLLLGIIQAFDLTFVVPDDYSLQTADYGLLGDRIAALRDCRFCGTNGLRFFRVLTRVRAAEQIKYIIAQGKLVRRARWFGIDGFDAVPTDIPIFLLLLALARQPELFPLVKRVLDSDRRAEVLWCCRAIKGLVGSESSALQAVSASECAADAPGFAFYDLLCQLSDQLRELPQDGREQRINSAILQLNDVLRDSDVRILGACGERIERVESITVLKSHAKTPLLVRVDGSRAFIVKSGDSVAQDCFVQGVLYIFRKYFAQAGARAVLYGIVPFSATSGFISVIPNASSLDEIGNKTEQFFTDFCRRSFTRQHMRNFTASFAFCAVSQYILQFKDRHNGNIMLTADGDICHIDFGFLLETAPGNQFSIEKAPFKYPNAFASLMGQEYQAIFIQIFTRAMYSCRYFALELKEILQLIVGVLPCCTRQETPNAVFQRTFCSLSGPELVQKCKELIEASKGSLSSVLYDRFQALQNDINC